MKSILDVGGTGFIGFHICKLALKKKFRVISISLKNRKKIFEEVKNINVDIANFKD